MYSGSHGGGGIPSKYGEYQACRTVSFPTNTPRQGEKRGSVLTLAVASDLAEEPELHGRRSHLAEDPAVACRRGHRIASSNQHVLNTKQGTSQACVAQMLIRYFWHAWMGNTAELRQYVMSGQNQAQVKNTRRPVRLCLAGPEVDHTERHPRWRVKRHQQAVPDVGGLVAKHTIAGQREGRQQAYIRESGRMSGRVSE